MRNTLKQLKKTARAMRLSAVEKSTMRGALMRHMKAHPVRSVALMRRHLASGYGFTPSPFSITSFRNTKTMPLIAILGLLVGGSVSFAAENTIPGDVLYPVKVHVNESVRGAVAITPKAEAAWDVRLVERRLEEVEKLAQDTTVSPDVQQLAQANLAEYTDRVKERIAQFEEDEDAEDAIETAGNLAETLSEHEATLATLAGTQQANTLAGASVATSTAAAATTTLDVAVASASAQSILDILNTIRGEREHAEGKHKELKKKYHQEDAEDDNTEDDANDEDDMPANWTPAPAGTSTAAVSGAQTGTTTVVGRVNTGANVSQWIRIGDHADAMESIEKKNREREKKNEEFRATPTSATSTPAVSEKEKKNLEEKKDEHND